MKYKDVAEKYDVSVNYYKIIEEQIPMGQKRRQVHPFGIKMRRQFG
ncbi:MULTISPECIES: hypothetical protein [Bacillus cereus group]|nr:MULTISPECIES: hypothetical protein [Bacillus cereus group]MCU7668383.1 hypothetical protein [Bacillus thuringiensis]